MCPSAIVKIASGKAILERLKNLRFPGLPQKPLFGPELAARANREGVTIRTVAEDASELGPTFLQKLLRAKNVRALTLEDKVPDNPGVFMDWAGYGPNALNGKDFLGRRSKAMERLAGRMGASKAVEAENLPGLLPRTIRLDNIIREIGTRNPEKLHAALMRRFRGRYIIKMDNSAASSADSLPTDLRGADGLRDYLSGVRGRDVVVQPRLDLQPLDRVGRMMNHTAQLHFDGRLPELAGILSRNPETRRSARTLWRAVFGGKPNFPLEYSLTGGKAKEYRVHVLNGKRIPYATSERGTVRGGFPWRTGNHRRAEQAVDEMLANLPADQKARLQGGFGFDVAQLRGKKGWKVIETNPSEVGGGSGFMAHPEAQDALAAAIQGRLPRYIKIQRGIEGTALGGAGLIGLNTLSGPDT